MGNNSNPAWKRLERRIAEKFGTFRTPLSGSSSRHTASDTLHPELYIEIKYSGKKNAKGEKQITIKKEWLDEMLVNAQDENKVPMLSFAFAKDYTGRVWSIIPQEFVEMIYKEEDTPDIGDGDMTDSDISTTR